MTCAECGHAEMVHFVMVGCCGHLQCPCEGVDGASRCRRDRHGEDCWWAIPKPAENTENRTVSVLALHLSGIGVRRIAARLQVPRAVVRATIRKETVQ